MAKQYTYQGWKQAIKRAYPSATFYGSKDIGGATHEGKQVGEWDGSEGEVETPLPAWMTSTLPAWMH